MKRFALLLLVAACGGDDKPGHKPAETPELVPCDTMCTPPEGAVDGDPRWMEFETCQQEALEAADAECIDLGLHLGRKLSPEDPETVHQLACFSSCVEDEPSKWSTCKDLVWLPYCIGLLT